MALRPREQCRLGWIVLLVWAWFCMAAPFAHRHAVPRATRPFVARAESGACGTCSWTTVVGTAQCVSSAPPLAVDVPRPEPGIPTPGLAWQDPIACPSRAPPFA